MEGRGQGGMWGGRTRGAMWQGHQPPRMARDAAPGQEKFRETTLAWVPWSSPPKACLCMEMHSSLWINSPKVTNHVSLKPQFWSLGLSWQALEVKSICFWGQTKYLIHPWKKSIHMGFGHMKKSSLFFSPLKVSIKTGKNIETSVKKILTQCFLPQPYPVTNIEKSHVD